MVKYAFTRMEIKETVSWVSIFVARKHWRRRRAMEGGQRWYRNTVVQGKPFGSYAWMVHCRDITRIKSFTSYVMHNRKTWAPRLVRRKT